MYRFDVGKRPDSHGETRAFYEVNVKQGEKILASEFGILFPLTVTVSPLNQTLMWQEYYKWLPVP